MENYKTSKKLMTKSEKALGISREQHSRQPKRRARDDETRWNSTKTMSNSKIKVANLKFRSKKHSTCVRIQLIDELFPIGCRKSKFKPKNQHQSRVTGWYPPKLCQSPKIIGDKPKIPNQKSFHMCEICTHGRAHHFNSPHGCCNLKFRQKHHLWSKRNWMESYDTMSKPKKKKSHEPRIQNQSLPTSVSTKNCNDWQAHHFSSSHRCTSPQQHQIYINIKLICCQSHKVVAN